MYGPGRMGYLGGGRRVGPFGGSASPALVVGLVVGGLFLFSLAGSFDFFPFFLFFWWMVPFVLVPMIFALARGVAGLFEARGRRPVDGEHKERELLEVLARHGEITPARAALETTLSVAEADRMLSELAKNGHIEVRARDGRLGYALWEHDRRELTG
jgi:hypothetical protein